jgi:hypothetical protein
MRMFDVQGIEIMAPCRKVFEFLREPANLPRWADAFVSAADDCARLETSAGTVEVGLEVAADAPTGVVDWRLTFPDGSVRVAQSRVTKPRAERASTAPFCMRLPWLSNTSRAHSTRSVPPARPVTGFAHESTVGR